MKYRLIELLKCPNTGSALSLDVFKTKKIKQGFEGINSVQCKNWCALHQQDVLGITASHCNKCYCTDIEEGRLISEGGYEYPIIEGIPRILPNTIIAETLFSYHADFIEKYKIKLPETIENTGSVIKKVRTIHAFGYQWTTFKNNFDYFKSIFLSFVEPYLKAEDFNNKLVLEVGCGSGRPASVASSFGAEVVAVDLSEAVKTAHSMSSNYPKLHVVQADAYALPFSPVFDFVYSVGVLQHIPDPNKALKSISQVLLQDRKLVLWVYGVREFWYQPIEWMRKFTTKMPYAILRLLSFVLAVISELFLLIPYRILRKISVFEFIANKIPGRIYADFPFKENVLGWFDRLVAPVTYYFSKSDIENMLLEAGFSGIQITARKQASASWVIEAHRANENIVKDK